MGNDVASCVVVARVVGTIATRWAVVDLILLGLIVIEGGVAVACVPSGIIAITAVEDEGILLGLVALSTSLIIVEIGVVAAAVPSRVVSVLTIEDEGILLGLIICGTFTRFIGTNDTIGAVRVAIGMSARVVAEATVV